jgi:hypothetical protein
MEELRKVKIRSVKPKIEITGLFHRWFNKKYDDGTSILFAVVENSEDGKIEFYDASSVEIIFIKPEIPIRMF